MKKGLATRRMCGLIVALLPLAAWAAGSSSTPEPVKPAVERPALFDERTVADF
ncbi:MAG: hypothetical protein HYY46_16000, partial [Deltaproteobacteria bacterium]|nr:hypothetical protein [Deltaproteobacteria bacterium]